MIGRFKRPGRGRPEQTAAQRFERDRKVTRMIDAVMARGVKRGDWVKLQAKVQRETGIASADFYRILARHRRLRALFEKVDADVLLTQEHLSPAELEKYKHHSARAVTRLARARSRR